MMFDDGNPNSYFVFCRRKTSCRTPRPVEHVEVPSAFQGKRLRHLFPVLHDFAVVNEILSDTLLTYINTSCFFCYQKNQDNYIYKYILCIMSEEKRSFFILYKIFENAVFKCSFKSFECEMLKKELLLIQKCTKFENCKIDFQIFFEKLQNI